MQYWPLNAGGKVRLSQGKEGKCPSDALDNRLDEVSLEWQRRAGTYSSAASTRRVLGNGGALGLRRMRCAACVSEV